MFEDCKNLEQITLFNKLDQIESECFVDCKYFTIYYLGTVEDWERIEKQKGWKKGSCATVVCVDGVVKC